MEHVSEKSIERITLYRRILLRLQKAGRESIYSHELARLSGSLPAKVRRDLMSIGYSGTPVHGYKVGVLLESISEFIDRGGKTNVAIVGIGNLGRSIAGYIQGRRSKMDISALFDKDPILVDRVIIGIRCYHIDELAKVVKEKDIQLAIITVPEGEAQAVADVLISAGIKGILNYAPLKLQTPPDVYIEDRDMIMAVEKVAYYSRNK